MLKRKSAELSFHGLNHAAEFAVWFKNTFGAIGAELPLLHVMLHVWIASRRASPERFRSHVSSSKALQQYVNATGDDSFQFLTSDELQIFINLALRNFW